jgi:murein DD-endopeptidase MepM/ murein hydrolase activator NlpD
MIKILRNFPMVLVSVMITTAIFLLGFTNERVKEPIELYHVYLNGKSIGLIESKAKLENYIDKEQKALKEKYNVDKVYAPNGLVIQKELTYNGKVLSAKEVYEKIKDIESFTIDGYVITIKGDDDTKYIYTLDKEYFKKAVEKTVNIFMGETNYNNYINDTQEEIKDFGSIIENVYIDEEITIKQTHIPTNENIITSEEDMAKYVLFSTTEKQKTYTVQAGDTIEKVAYNHQLSSEEFLVANPEFTDVTNLLYPGQEVIIGLISPQISVVVEKHIVEKQIRRFETIIKYDPSLAMGSGYEKQAGADGEDKVTMKVRYVNGYSEPVYIVSTEELKPVINRIYIKGGKIIPYVGDSKYWGWPTIKHCRISDVFGYSRGRLHAGIDISGCGKGSPIYATNNGTVIFTGYEAGGYGNWIEIDHNNGYTTRYGHLSKIYVKKGETVEKGHVIGAMGSTGRSSGTHLHYEIRYHGVPYNPLNFYK